MRIGSVRRVGGAPVRRASGGAMKRTLVAAVLTAIVLGVSAVGFSEEEQRPAAAAPEAAAPAAGAKEAEPGGCMPGGGCCGAAADLKCVLVPGTVRLLGGRPRFRKARALLYRKYPHYPDEAAVGESASVIGEGSPTRVFSWGLE